MSGSTVDVTSAHIIDDVDVECIEDDEKDLV